MPARRDASEALFDSEAEWYDAAHDARRIEGHALRARGESIRALLGPGPGEVLDAGMGPGRLLSELAQTGWTVSGIDLSARMVERARARLPAASERLTQAPIEALPFAAASFDAAVVSGVLEFVDDRGAAMAELSRVLRPSGRLVGSIPNRGALDILAKRAYYPAVRLVKRFVEAGRAAPGLRSSISLSTLEQLLAAQGLTLGEVRYTSFAVVPTPLDRLVPVIALRAAELLEARAGGLGRVLGAQIVFSAEKQSGRRA
ncbi:MAG: hypothetical protein QOE29_906 [Gaiellaceae bacterium]|nr:hypothetical protein [Gaiellaceae bacterium]